MKTGQMFYHFLSVKLFKVLNSSSSVQLTSWFKSFLMSSFYLFVRLSLAIFFYSIFEMESVHYLCGVFVWPNFPSSLLDLVSCICNKEVRNILCIYILVKKFFDSVKGFFHKFQAKTIRFCVFKLRNNYSNCPWMMV